MITIFGATGYTGELVARELCRQGAEIVLAGRNEAKLLVLKEKLGGSVRIAVADVSDQGSLLRMCRGSRVVVNCAGPFLRLGWPVVEAAVRCGVHYLDTTGEQSFMKDLLRLDQEARERGVAVVSAVAGESLSEEGYDY